MLINKYVTIGAGITILAMGATIWYLTGVIEDKNKEIGQLEVQLIACEASNDNLVAGIDKQNAKIDEFNVILENKNKELSSIQKNNRALLADITKKNQEIDKIKLDTCEETMDWLLEEAVTDEDFYRSTTE